MQYIPIRELWGGFASAKHEGRFMILRGYFDESYNDKIFSFSCLMSDFTGWKDIEHNWKLCLKAKNKALKAAGRQQLSRYHAADCSSLVGEFAGWTVTEQVSFVKELLACLDRGRAWVNTISYSVPLEDFVREMPQWADDPLSACYGELLKFSMLEIVAQVNDAKKLRPVKPVSFVLFPERCNYDGILLGAFNAMMRDAGFAGKEMFSTIAPLGWEHCVPLQAADMIAYENFKESERKITGRKRRKSLEYLMTTNRFGGRSKGLSTENLRQWRGLLKPLEP
jgi:hypothetical protein